MTINNKKSSFVSRTKAFGPVKHNGNEKSAPENVKSIGTKEKSV
jgi:hypothetical protein